MTDTIDNDSTVDNLSNEAPAPEVQVTPASAPVLETNPKVKVLVLYPQSNKPELSVNGGDFIKLPWKSVKTVIEVDKVFPLKLQFKNEKKTFKPKVFDYYEPINPTSEVSIMRYLDVTEQSKRN